MQCYKGPWALSGDLITTGAQSGVQIPEGNTGGKPGTGSTSSSPRKPAKAEASIKISADASKQHPSAEKAPTAAATGSDAAKPQVPILPRSAASYAGAKAPAKKEEPNVLTMPRDEAWPRLLAYEVRDQRVACIVLLPA